MKKQCDRHGPKCEKPRFVCFCIGPCVELTKTFSVNLTSLTWDLDALGKKYKE